MWDKSGVNLGINSRVNLGSIWDQSGVNLRSIWGRSGVNLGSKLFPFPAPRARGAIGARGSDNGRGLDRARRKLPRLLCLFILEIAEDGRLHLGIESMHHEACIMYEKHQ